MARQSTLVLCYHALSEDWPTQMAVAPRQFERQCRWVIGRGYRPVSFSEAALGERPGKSVAVTFDDAYRSVFELAFPILRRLGIPATVFVPTRRLDPDRGMVWPGIENWQDGPWSSELTGMTWDQIRELASAGWEIGSHTRTHPRLARLGDAELKEELEGSRSDCSQEIGRTCRSIAYPYGDVDHRVVAAAVDAGYESGAALITRSPRNGGRRDPMRWPRVGVYRHDRDLQLRTKSLLLTRYPWGNELRAGRMTGADQDSLED